MSAAPPGTYPGNPSLPREVRDKILSTFRHTLNLYKEGKAEDCLIGCDFILKMDPRFGPARQLMEKAKNPASVVDVAALETVVAEAPVRAERASTPETDRLLVRAAESFNTRDFDAAIASAEQVLQVLPGNHDATEILRKARERKNAQPQFEVARQRAIAALDSRRDGEAQAALEKMRSLDADHPAVALLERRLARPAAAPATELGESTNPGLDPGTAGAAPAATPPPPPRFHDEPAGGLGELSLDSLSLDDDSSAVVPPPPDMGASAGGPLSLSFSEPPAASDRSTHDPVPGAPNLWSDAPAESEFGGLSLDMPSEEPAASAPAPAFGGPPPSTPAAPEPPSQQQEIASLLERGDAASNGGNRQQAIEIWSRIFLIDINNAEAVARIEKARQEMAEGNKRIVEGLKRGREAFEAGDFTAAREAFLQVLAFDETDATARSYLDRIEAELARPSSGLDLAKKTPQSDILSEEMADAAAIEEAAPSAVEDAAPPRIEKPGRAPLDRRFVMALGAAFLLAILVGGYMMLRGRRVPAASPASAEGAPSLEHATALFRDGKIPETVAELKRIPREHPDYARAQKLLASLTKKSSESADAGTGEAGTAAEKAEAPAAAPPPEAVHQRQDAEKALAEKRYIDALTAFNLAAPAFEKDPTFAQSLGAASEKVSELTPAVKLYNEGEYETAIPILWRIFQADRENQDARSYLLRCYYNEGIGQLQNGLYGKAADTFKEVIAIDPADADATRHEKFAQHYAKGDLDLMGRIYVRHIQQRP